MKSEFEKMVAGELYSPMDEKLIKARARAREFIKLYQTTESGDLKSRESLLHRYFGSMGIGAYIEPPFHCDYGCNLHIGNNFYCNFDCLFLDSAPITIGHNVMLGPGVHIYTPCHPLQKDDRRSGLEQAKAVHIGNDVWIGGRAVICPGVTIGDGAVVGAGSVVTRDVQPNTVVAGNPAKTIRAIDQNHRMLP